MENRYYINRNGKIYGPFTKDAIKKAAHQGKITLDDMISKSNHGPWTKVPAAKDYASAARQPSSSHSADEENWLQSDLQENYSDLLPIAPMKRKTKKPAAGGKTFSLVKKKKKSARKPIDYDSLSLATPWQRLVAQFVDGLAGTLSILPGLGLCLIGFQEHIPGRKPPALFVAGVLVACLGLLVVLVANFYLLTARAQTIGKWNCNLQIFDAETRRPAGLYRNWFLRMAVNHAITLIPIVGSFYSLIDILYIFRDDHRCLHDHLAGTEVMDIST